MAAAPYPGAPAAAWAYAKLDQPGDEDAPGASDPLCAFQTKPSVRGR
jgi:hypothetical protein